MSIRVANPSLAPDASQPLVYDRLGRRIHPTTAALNPSVFISNRYEPAMTHNTDLQQRFIELETRLAFQEHTLQEMSDTVARQQAEIDLLTRTLKETQQRLRGIS